MFFEFKNRTIIEVFIIKENWKFFWGYYVAYLSTQKILEISEKV